MLQTVAYGIGKATDCERTMALCADVFYRLGCASTLGGPLGLDHDIMGAEINKEASRNLG